jgi:16S rRNA processing protein RimM
VLRSHGVRGELLLEALTDFPEAFLGKTVTIQERGGTQRRLRVAAVRWHRRRLLIQFEGCADRATADELRDGLVQIEVAQAEPLAAGQYYHHQIVGLRAVTEAGEALGLVDQIIETGANDVYVVKTPAGSELLLPAIASVIKKIDLEAGEMVVHLLEGLRTD